ncbi:antitoxin VapB family protein [Natronorarus salvus]|uniref:antitoxin VapB family protein n=1 Tax=Natronorarus salvus TaxID=3117733 RepID=UPI002F266EDD
MGSKTVRLDDDVYERLRAHKRDDETFSEAVDRLLGEHSLLDLVGIYSEEEVEEVESALVEKERRDAARRRESFDRSA